MQERSTARQNAKASTRTENRKRASEPGGGVRKSTSRPPSVGVIPVLRRMFSRALQRKSTAAEQPARENRRHSSAPPRPAWDTRMAGFRDRMVGPIGAAKRFGTGMLRGMLVLAIAGGAVAVGRLIEAHVRRSDAFATKLIDVQGNERLQRSEVLAAATLAVGKNAFAVSPEEAERALLKNPWIASAQVTRRLPDTYTVTIEERQAVAILALDQSYLVAGDAAVFKRWQPGDPEDVPVITGVDSANFTNDRVYRTSILVNAVALLHDYRDAGLWRRAPIQEIHVESDEGLTLFVGEDATTVRLHRPPFRKKLTRLKRVLEQLAVKDVEPAYVYLDNVRRGDRVTVQLR